MMALVFGLVLVAATASLVWRVARRLWHLLPIFGLALLVLPAMVIYLTGDVSRYLPRAMFAEGAAGKDQVAVLSAVASICVAAILAAGLWALAQLVFQRVRRH